MTEDEQYMLECVREALQGAGQVAPNPLVGSLIVCGGNVIGNGFHHSFGANHAEVEALKSCEGQSLSESVLYVNLEPCVHFGKTPPCTRAIQESGVRKVVIGLIDPNPAVSGAGVAQLRESGIEVCIDVLRPLCRHLNRRFCTGHEYQRPYVILKWAETQDGFIARKDFSSKWISGETSRELVHYWRATEDAILVGTNTAAYDNPRLNCRLSESLLRYLSEIRHPLRVVLDLSVRLPQELRLFDGSQPTLRVVGSEAVEEAEGVEVLYLESRESWVQDLLSELLNRGVLSLIVEGGTQVIESFVKLGLWDEARIFRSEKSFGEGVAAPELQGTQVFQESIGDDLLRVVMNPDFFVEPEDFEWLLRAELGVDFVREK